MISCINKNYTKYPNRIVIPDNLYSSVIDERKYHEMLSEKYKILVYIDSTACGSCWANNIVRWYDIVNYVESKDSIVSLMMIFSPQKKDKELWQGISSLNPLDYPIFIDTGYSMSNQIKNSFIGLIDGNNMVVLQGNPLSSINKWNNYIDIIESNEEK